MLDRGESARESLVVNAISGREAALGAGLFVVLLGITWLAPLAAVPAAGALVFIALVASQRRRLRQVEVRLEALDHTVRDANSGIILLEHAQEPVRIVGAPIDVTWNRGMIAQDVANYLVQQIFLRRPERILECGAGVSTRVIGRALRTAGRGHLWTLEHDPHWASQIRTIIDAEGLAAWVDVIHAPLVEHTASGNGFIWYANPDGMRDLAPFDLVFVDGPPAARPEHPGREGALYALFPLMRPGALMLMDDGFREGERNAVDRWARHFGDAIHHELLPLRNGLWVIERTGQ